MTFAPVEDEGILHLTFKKGTKKIFEDTLTISGGALVVSSTDTVDKKKISLAQGTTIKIANDHKIITANAKGIFLFQN